MSKKIRDYLTRGLAAAVLTGAAFFSGCRSVDVYHEVFRNNERKNAEPVAKAIEVDYSKYDQQNKYKLVERRAYLDGDVKPNPTLESVVDVPSSEIFRIPALGADTTFIEDPNGGIIMQYKSRLPAPDLQKLISPYLKNIKIEPYANQNVLIFSGSKKAFNFDEPNNPERFRYLTTLLNQFDLPAMQIRIRMKIAAFFKDNTYDRDEALKLLKDKMNFISLNLPSSPDPTTKLATGIDINPFYNQNSNGYTIESAIKFLDSYGETRSVADLEALTSNGRTADLLNTASIPYPEAIVVGLNVVDAIKYRDTGTTVKVTPFANDQGFITVKLEKAESGEHTGYYGTFQRPTFSTADLKSEFVVRNGVPYYIGTSLFERYKEVKRGIPALSLIPFVGDLFSSKSIENNQTQLVYLLEARVVSREDTVGTSVRQIKTRMPSRIEELVGLDGYLLDEASEPNQVEPSPLEQSLLPK